MNDGRHIEIGDTRLWVVERGAGLPLITLHGGPGLDHHSWGDYLDALGDRYRLVLVDQRSQGLSEATRPTTWTVAQMAQDVTALAAALGYERYAVLGHSYGAFVALQHAVDMPGAAVATIISSGVPSARFLSEVEHQLAIFEPLALREQVAAAWAAERTVQTQAEVARLMHNQLPFHFREPLDPRIADFERRTTGAVFAPAMLRHFANADYGSIEVEARLAAVTQPVLVLAGRHDRVCPVAAAETIAAGIPHAQFACFEQSAHMTFAEENPQYIALVRAFLDQHVGAN